MELVAQQVLAILDDVRSSLASSDEIASEARLSPCVDSLGARTGVNRASVAATLPSATVPSLESFTTWPDAVVVRSEPSLDAETGQQAQLVELVLQRDGEQFDVSLLIRVDGPIHVVVESRCRGFDSGVSRHDSAGSG